LQSFNLQTGWFATPFRLSPFTSHDPGSGVIAILQNVTNYLPVDTAKQTLLGLLYLKKKKEDTTVIRNVGNCLPVNTAKQPKKHIVQPRTCENHISLPEVMMRLMKTVLCIWHCNTKIKPQNTFFFFKSNFNTKTNMDVYAQSAVVVGPTRLDT
jgi:hypothetical protein